MEILAWIGDLVRQPLLTLTWWSCIDELWLKCALLHNAILANAQKQPPTLRQKRILQIRPWTVLYLCLRNFVTTEISAWRMRQKYLFILSCVLICVLFQEWFKHLMQWCGLRNPLPQLLRTVTDGDAFGGSLFCMLIYLLFKNRRDWWWRGFGKFEDCSEGMEMSGLYWWDIIQTTNMLKVLGERLWVEFLNFKGSIVNSNMVQAEI